MCMPNVQVHRSGHTQERLVCLSIHVGLLLCFGFEMRSHIGLELTKQARLAGRHIGPELFQF